MFNKKNKRITNGQPNKIYNLSLIVIFVFCLLSYGYFVREATVNIVARQNMEKEISSITSNVLVLESEYIKEKNNVTIEMAQNLGFVAVSNKKFVTTNIKTPGLSLLTPAI